MSGDKSHRLKAHLCATTATAALPILLAACGTTYNVQHVPKADFYRSGNTPGLYFTLPRTNVVLEFLVEETKSKYGQFYGGDEIINTVDSKTETFKQRLAFNLGKCKSDPSQVRPISRDDLVSGAEFEASDYALSTLSVQDLDKIYRMDASAGPFANYKYVLELNDDGTIKASSASLEDTRAAFALKVAESFIKIPAAAALGGSGTPPTEEMKKAYCPDFERLKADKEEFERKLSDAGKRRQAILDGALKVADGAILTVALAEIDKEIAAIKKKAAATIANFEKSDASETYVVVGRHDPEDYNGQALPAGHAAAPKKFAWTGYKPKFEAKKDGDAAKRIPIKIGNPAATQDGVPLPDDLQASLNEITPNLTASFVPGLRPAGSTAAAAADEKVTGYPYRFPVGATVDVIRTEVIPPPTGSPAGTASTTKTTMLASATVPVAQFGPLLSLPNSFPGTSGDVEVAYNNATGGLSKASIGGKAITSTSASGYIDAVGGYLDAERKGNQADAKKAEEDAKAAANAETKALEDKVKYLEALKKFRALEKEMADSE